MSTGNEIDADATLKITVTTLKDKLRELGLGVGVGGRKHELRERLLQHLGLIDVGDDDDNEEYDSPSNQSDCELVPEQPRPHASVRKAHFTFKDIEESLSTFDGTDTCDVRKWIEHLEENAEIVNWNEVHIFIYAKQLLRDAANFLLAPKSGCAIGNL